MVKHHSVTLEVPTHSLTAGPSAGLETRVRQFQFRIDQKRTRLGDTEVSQWWMPVNTLYPLRGKKETINYTAIVDYFWALCLSADTCLDDDVTESYLLASLLPDIRSQGSARIVSDSQQFPKDYRRLVRKAAGELEELLIASAGQEMSPQEFRDQTANALGPPQFDDGDAALYGTMCEKLLTPARQVMRTNGEGAGVRQARHTWNRWIRQIGRRKGNEDRKRMLDILSYEAKAAFHRAYSATWFELIPHLTREHRLSPQEVRFLWFWHLDLSYPAVERDDAQFHLFHGHIFGLHPASGPFLLTTAGPRLVEAWLTQNGRDAETAYRRLLHGLSIAVFEYAKHRDEQRHARKKQPHHCDIDALDPKIVKGRDEKNDEEDDD